MRKILTLTILISLLSTSCSTQKGEYNFISKTLDDLKAPFHDNSIDSIELVNYSFKILPSFLEGYTKQKEIFIKGRIQSSEGNFFWKDKNNSWAITSEDVEYMKMELAKQKKKIWDEKKINTKIKSVKIVDYPTFSNHSVEDNERIKRIKTGYYLYFFSNPIFNKKRDIAIVSYNIVLLPQSFQTLIYKKDKNEWKLIGSYY